MKWLIPTMILMIGLGCSQPTATLSDDGPVNTLPPELLERTKQLNMEEAERETFALLLELVEMQQDIPEIAEIPDDVRDFWAAKATSVARTGSVAGGVLTTGLLTYAVLEKFDGAIAVINKMGKAAKDISGRSYDRIENSINAVLNLPGVRRFVDASSAFSNRAFERIVVKPLNLIVGRKGGGSAVVASIGASFLSSYAASRSVNGETYVRNSELMRFVMGYDAHVIRHVEPQVDVLEKSFGWTTEEANRFRAAFANHIIELAIENDFDTDVTYEVRTLDIIEEEGLGKGKLEAARNMHLLIEATAENRDPEEVETKFGMEETLTIMAAVACHLQVLANDGDISKARRDRIKVLLANAESAFHNYEARFDLGN